MPSVGSGVTVDVVAAFYIPGRAADKGTGLFRFASDLAGSIGTEYRAMGLRVRESTRGGGMMMIFDAAFQSQRGAVGNFNPQVMLLPIEISATPRATGPDRSECP